MCMHLLAYDMDAKRIRIISGCRVSGEEIAFAIIFSMREHRNIRWTAPKSPAYRSFVRIPTPDAIVYVSSQLAPMRSYGFMSVYGGLVPLGFAHSNLTNVLQKQYNRLSPFVYPNTLCQKSQSLFRLTKWGRSAILLASEYPFECLWVW